MSSDTATRAQAHEPLPGAASSTGSIPLSAWQRQLLRFGYAAGSRTPVHQRLSPPMAEPDTRSWSLLGINPALVLRLSRISGWGGPILIALIAGVLRFWHLGSPHAVIFDETYYAKDAWSLLHLGYEGSWPDGDAANKAILADPQRIPLSSKASYIVHPPVGKWIISIGEWLFGLHPFGWRFMMALLGTLSVLMLCRIGRRLFRSTALGCLAGALMTLDGLHLVMSRTALLDLVVMFWVLAAFGALLIDRDNSRARLAAALPDPGPDDMKATWHRHGFRPWRLAAGVFLGLACATKWNGLYVLAAFGVMSVLWDLGARKAAGSRHPYRSVARRDLPLAFLSLVPVAIAVYIASWAGWFASDKAYLRHWAGNGHSNALVGAYESLISLWNYHKKMYDFHTHLTTPHTYESNPWSWLVQGRPVLYFYESPKNGQSGCRVTECARTVLGLGTPLLWWTAVFALLYLLYRWVLRRDWRAGAILCGVIAGYLPWFVYQNRTIFLFYAVVFVPFLCLAVAMMLGAMVGPRRAPVTLDGELSWAGDGGADTGQPAFTRAVAWAGGAGADPEPTAAVGAPGQRPQRWSTDPQQPAQPQQRLERRRLLGIVVAGLIVLLIVWNFIYFWPIYTGQTIPVDSWRDRMWFDTWI